MPSDSLPEADGKTRPSEFEFSKAPFIRRVKVSNYKSIVRCDVNLTPMTILVGRNGSGKSNFVDALAFMAAAVKDSVKEATNSRNGWLGVSCRASASSSIEMAIEASFSSLGRGWEADYSFSLGDRAKVVASERLLLRDTSTGVSLGYKRIAGNVEWFGEDIFKDSGHKPPRPHISRPPSESSVTDPRLFRHVRSDRLILGIVGTQPFLDLSEGIGGSGFYNFNPSMMRSHQPKSGSPFLHSTGRNLARAIEGLLEVDPERLDRLKSYLSTVVQDVLDFRVVEYGDMETVRFKMKSLCDNANLEFDASSMSDGTLRTLAALVAAFQISLPLDHGMIAIEEPETALHPSATRALVDALDEATQNTQILLTTHSADLIDDPDVPVSAIRIVRTLEGMTQITPISPANREAVKQKLYTPGDLFRLDQLDVDDADISRQSQADSGEGQK